MGDTVEGNVALINPKSVETDGEKYFYISVSDSLWLVDFAIGLWSY